MNVGKATEPWAANYAHACDWDQSFAPLAMTELFAASVTAYGERPLSDFLEAAVDGSSPSLTPCLVSLTKWRAL